MDPGLRRDDSVGVLTLETLDPQVQAFSRNMPPRGMPELVSRAM
jgi:hypothetical protein